MSFSLIHIFNKLKFDIRKRIQIFSARCSNFKFDFPLLFKLKETTIINSWVDYRNGILYNRNLGDDLNYYLLNIISNDHIRFKDCSFLSIIKRTNYLCIGSVIHHGNKNSIVWGAGCISQDGHIPKLKSVLAVRGPKTRECLISAGINCPKIYGDPVLLLPLIYRPTINKSNKIGIVLNMADESSFDLITTNTEDPFIKISVSKYSEWREVIDKIAECKLIISSSLHGLIIADAYNIPNIWVSVNGNNNVIGGDFKYLDYLESVKRHQLKPIDIEELMNNGVDKYLYLIDKPEIDLRPLLDKCPLKIDKSIINQYVS